MKNNFRKRIAFRILPFLLICCLLVSLFPLSAFAADVVGSGTCGVNGDNLTWTLDSDGLLTISGTGDMESWQENGEHAPWYDDSLYVQRILIEDGVTSIGAKAFEECEYMTDIAIPETVTAIGHDAFFDCMRLPAITLPAGLKIIDDQVFAFCEALSSIIIPDGVESIGYCAFGSCYSLTSLVLPAGLTHLNENVFYDCPSMQEINVASENPCL